MKIFNSVLTKRAKTSSPATSSSIFPEVINDSRGMFRDDAKLLSSHINKAQSSSSKSTISSLPLSQSLPSHWDVFPLYYFIERIREKDAKQNQTPNENKSDGEVINWHTIVPSSLTLTILELIHSADPIKRRINPLTGEPMPWCLPIISTNAGHAVPDAIITSMSIDLHTFRLLRY
jgi:hypothetical protein